MPELVPRIGALLRDAGEQLGEARFTRVAIGLTGLPDLIGDPDELVRLLRHDAPVSGVFVAADALTTHTGALGGRPGVVVAAGTGAVALGTDFRELWRRTDGWGLLLGDHGSGAWVGQQGLHCALRARDGRPGGSSELLSRLDACFGDVAQLEARVYQGAAPSSAVLASFAPHVADAAHAGDPVDRRVWGGAGTYLGETAAAALASGLAPRFSWGGGLFDVGELLRAPFRAEVLRQVPDAEFYSPAGSSVTGAQNSATVDGHPWVRINGTASGSGERTCRKWIL